MKFLFTAPRFHTNLYYPIKSLLDHGHQVQFLALYQGQSEAHDLIKPTILGSWYELPPIFLFVKLFIRSRADIVVVKDIVTRYSLLALFLGWLLRKKLIVLTQIPKFRVKKQSWSIKMLDLFGVQAITPVLGDRKFTSSNRNLLYVPFVVLSNDKTYTQYSNLTHEITILCVGKFQERKRQLLLIKAVEKLRHKFAVKLLLSGEENEPKYLAEITNYIKDNQLGSVISVIKHMPWKEMGFLYQKADLFVLPSVGESAAYSILEAMGYGLPVISSDDNGTQCYIRNGENGFVFKKDDLTDLIDKIEKILANHDHLQRMGQTSFNIATTDHNPEVFYNSLMEIIRHK